MSTLCQLNCTELHRWINHHPRIKGDHTCDRVNCPYAEINVVEARAHCIKYHKKEYDDAANGVFIDRNSVFVHRGLEAPATGGDGFDTTESDVEDVADSEPATPIVGELAEARGEGSADPKPATVGNAPAPKVGSTEPRTQGVAKPQYSSRGTPSPMMGPFSGTPSPMQAGGFAPSPVYGYLPAPGPGAPKTLTFISTGVRVNPRTAPTECCEFKAYFDEVMYLIGNTVVTYNNAGCSNLRCRDRDSSGHKIRWCEGHLQTQDPETYDYVMRRRATGASPSPIFEASKSDQDWRSKTAGRTGGGRRQREGRARGRHGGPKGPDSTAALTEHLTGMKLDAAADPPQGTKE